MTLDEINQQHPEHQRSSCSDDLLYNKGFNKTGCLYCIRCHLLHHLQVKAEAGRAGFVACYERCWRDAVGDRVPEFVVPYLSNEYAKRQGGES